MANQDEMARVWTGLDLLQAKMMQEVLKDAGIECFLPAEADSMDMLGARTDYVLWVHQQDESRARELVEQVEEDMHDSLEGGEEVSD